MEFIQNFDNQTIEFLNGFVGLNSTLDLLFRFFAEYLILLVPISLVAGWFFAKKIKSANKALEIRVDLLEATLAGVFGWQVINRIIKIFYFRERPYESGVEFKELFFHRPDESFPSDHTTLLFTLVCYSYLLGWTKIANWALVFALIISLNRVITAIHWPSDIFGGMLVGVVTAYLFWQFRKPVREYIALPIVKFLTKIGL